MRRISHAFGKSEDLSYQGGTLRFQSNFLAVKPELDTCRATVTHLIMCRLMKAFDGKSKTVQFKIAEDFNRLNLDDPNINLYNLVQGYCADLASVGDSKPHSVGAVICTDCQSKTHETEDCPKRKQRELNVANCANNLKGKADKRARQHNCPDDPVLAVRMQSAEPSTSATHMPEEQACLVASASQTNTAPLPPEVFNGCARVAAS